jgi:hypothetical protein
MQKLLQHYFQNKLIKDYYSMFHESDLNFYTLANKYSRSHTMDLVLTNLVLSKP